MFLISSDYYEIRKTKKKGRGVYASKNIEAGTLIGDYLGIIIADDDLEKYEKKFGFYSMCYTTKTAIFPDIKKPDLYLFNHSCSPNCESFQFHGHMLFFALRKIFVGEELTINYFYPPEKDFDCVDICHCGSPVCRATMYCTDDRTSRWSVFSKKLDKKYWNKMEVKIGQVLPPLKKYPEFIPDYLAYDIYGNLSKKPLVFLDSFLPSIKELRKRIRESGRCLKFSKLKLSVYGVMDGLLLSCPIKK